MFAGVSRGGTDSPFFASAQRLPCTCRSRVSTSAEQSSLVRPSIRLSLTLAPSSGTAGTRTGAWMASATSSIEQMDIVERQNGTPNAAAAFAASHFAVGPGQAGKSGRTDARAGSRPYRRPSSRAVFALAKRRACRAGAVPARAGRQVALQRQLLVRSRHARNRR